MDGHRKAPSLGSLPCLDQIAKRLLVARAVRSIRGAIGGICRSRQPGAHLLPEVGRDRLAAAAVESLLDFPGQPFQRRRFLLLVSLEQAEGGADDFRSRLIASGVNRLMNEVFELQGSRIPSRPCCGLQRIRSAMSKLDSTSLRDLVRRSMRFFHNKHYAIISLHLNVLSTAPCGTQCQCAFR